MPSKGMAVSEELSGTTTDDYVALTEILMLGHKDNLLILKNTHATRGLIFKVLAYSYPSGNYTTLLNDITLAALDSYEIAITKPRYSVIVSVKSEVAGNAATYKLDYTLG